MDAMELKRMIVRWLLGEATEEEMRGLEEWRRGVEERGRLLERLAEGDFLQKAVGEDNRELRRRVWEGVERGIKQGSVSGSSEGLEWGWNGKVAGGMVQGGWSGGVGEGGAERGLGKGVRGGVKGRVVGRAGWWKGVAAVLLPVALAGAVWLLWGDGGNGVKGRAGEVAQRIEVGSAKAVVELADGERVFLVKDTVVDVQGAGVALVNRRDTLRLTGRGVGGHGGVESGAEGGAVCGGYGKEGVVGRGFHVVRIPRGGEYVAELGDGSVVHLNSASVLRVPVDFGRDGKREVWLEGEAYFDVAEDRGRVFAVHAGKMEVKVLGTEFGVRAYGEEAVATLVEGKVEVVSGMAGAVLEPGEQAVVERVGHLAAREVDVYPYVAWAQGRMVFVNERLEKILADLQRWYDFELFYANEEVKGMRFTMDILKYDDIGKVFGLMERMEKVEFGLRGRTVVVGKK